jgi:hypothetical protein
MSADRRGIDLKLRIADHGGHGDVAAFEALLQFLAIHDAPQGFNPGV